MKAVTLLDAFDFFRKIANCHALFLSLLEQPLPLRSITYILLKLFCFNSRKGPDVHLLLYRWVRRLLLAYYGWNKKATATAMM